MKKHMTVLLMVGMLALCLPLHLTAQQRETTLRKEIVKVNYIEVQEAWNILVNYRSPRGKIQMQRNRNMLIIEDSPEFVDKILSILKELDVKPMDLQFTVDVILGDKRSPDETVPPDPRISSDPLFAELRNLLKYDSLKRLDTTLIKGLAMI